MKTKKNWFVIVAAMIMSSVMIFASCSSDDDPMLPEVIESEVLDDGVDSNVTSKSNVAPDGTNLGTKLSYKSWIMVKGQTRAAFENKVEVTLNNAFNNTDTLVKVYDFIVEPPKVEVFNRKRSERQEGFVTVSDSVMVYSVQFAEFSFDYELDFEHAVYNDGVTKQNMPYHPIGTIKDNGYKLLDVDSEVSGDFAYACKNLKHSINVQFNGKTYKLKANVKLYRYIGSAYEPYILRSKLIAEGTWTSGENLITSVLNVHQVWSDGHTNDDPVACYFAYNDESVILEPAVVTVHKFNPDLNILKSELVEGRKEIHHAEGQYLEVFEKKHYWNVDYGCFSITIPLQLFTAHYDDGVLSRDLPEFKFTNVTSQKPELVFENSGYDANGNYSVYWLTQKVTVRIDKVTFVKSGVVQIIAYDE